MKNLLILLSSMSLYLVGYSNRQIYNRMTNCDESKIVVDIGGCNGDGFCAVLLSDFSKNYMYLPLKGQPFCKE